MQEVYISSEKRQQIIDALKLFQIWYKMEYQKIMSLLDIASNSVPKFSTKFNTLSNL